MSDDFDKIKNTCHVDSLDKIKNYTMFYDKQIFYFSGISITLILFIVYQIITFENFDMWFKIIVIFMSFGFVFAFVKCIINTLQQYLDTADVLGKQLEIYYNKDCQQWNEKNLKNYETEIATKRENVKKIDCCNLFKYSFLSLMGFLFLLSIIFVIN